jgi:hypothetical protein
MPGAPIRPLFPRRKLTGVDATTAKSLSLRHNALSLRQSFSRVIYARLLGLPPDGTVGAPR